MDSSRVTLPDTKTFRDQVFVSTEAKTSMHFVFVHGDQHVEQYICTDPVFDDVSGVQVNTDFLTEKRFEYIKNTLTEVYREDATDLADLSGYRYPLSHDDGTLLLYEFRKSMNMKPCSGGELHHASFCGTLRLREKAPPVSFKSINEVIMGEL